MNADGWTEQERVRKREGGREGRRGGVMPLLYSFFFGTYFNTSLPPSLPQALVTQLVPFRCVPGKQYNELASLFFTDSDTAIKQCEEGGKEGGKGEEDSTMETLVNSPILPPSIP